VTQENAHSSFKPGINIIHHPVNYTTWCNTIEKST